jgi:hypothetical protein
LIRTIASSTIIKTSVILKESVDWDEWVLIINVIAKRGDVSKYVDLTAAVKPAELTRPAIPMFLTIKSEAVSLADLD